MKYRKIKVVCTDCPKRFYRVMYVRSDLNLMQLGYAVLSSLRCEFEHAYLFRDKDRSYLPEEWLEDSFSGDKSLTDATLDDVHPFSGNKIILEYDTGDGWEFDLKMYKQEKEIDDDVYGINIEAKGDRIWEDERDVFWDFLNGDSIESDAVWNMPDDSEPENFDDPIDIDELNEETQVDSMDIFDAWNDGGTN